MPTISGSLSFIGASRFQGKWDASDNSGTGSAVPGGPTGSFSTLFSSSSPAAGYNSTHFLTASVGHYWQVMTAGSSNVDGITSWAPGDWIIYSGSASVGYKWTKLSFTDTVASIVVGDVLASTLLTTVANTRTLTSDATVIDNHNAVLIGPTTVSAGTNLTVQQNAYLKIKDIEDF